MQKFFSVILAFIFSFFGIPHSVNTNIPSPNPSPVEINKYIVQLSGKKYLIYLQKITDIKNLILIPNFTEKLTSSEIMKKHKCKYGINGGFYTTENKPLGLFYSDNKFIQNTIHRNDLFNGYFSKTFDNRLDISSNPPAFEKSDSDHHYQFVFQSGPFFTPQTKLTITEDQLARRILIGKSDKDEFYFLAITETENTHSGPNLADLPQIFSIFNNQLNAPFAVACCNSSWRAGKRYVLNTVLNMDGGSASAFYSENGTQFSELTPIGSFLCGK